MTSTPHARPTLSRTTIFVTAAITLALLALLLPPPSASGTVEVQTDRERVGVWHQYSVKFVCGRPNAPVVAPGRYFTAINVHNPNQGVARFRKKIAVALPGERPGPISPFFDATLKADQAFEIDCPDILRHARTNAPFLKGFVVIESRLELDVVAVYTAGGAQVETLHTERVPSRRMATQTASTADGGGADQPCPSGAPGARVGREGCCCNRPNDPNPMWPDCESGLECRGNVGTATVPANIYAVCTRPPGIVLPGLHGSQPPYCGQP
jgi:hypothetical protein